jgi:hypothetical protein
VGQISHVSLFKPSHHYTCASNYIYRTVEKKKAAKNSMPRKIIDAMTHTIKDGKYSSSAAFLLVQLFQQLTFNLHVMP